MSFKKRNRVTRPLPYDPDKELPMCKGIVRKRRRHHNNSGHRQIQRGRTAQQVAEIAARVGVPTS